MHRSKIGWCDYSGGNANFVVRGKKAGECEVSPACSNCYVKRYWQTNPEKWPDETTWYPEKLERLSRSRPSPGNTPYRRGPGSRPLVFVCDTGDLFHSRVPTTFIFSALDIFLTRRDVDWQILTKRHLRAHELIPKWLQSRRLSQMPSWMWMMFTVEDQTWLDTRLPYLLEIPAAVRGLSLEPLLGPVNVVDGPWWDWRYTWGFFVAGFPNARAPLDVLIVAGESDKIRPSPMRPDWVRSVLDQAKRAEIPFFFKQWGDYKPHSAVERKLYEDAGWDSKQFRGGQTIDGNTYTELPKSTDPDVEAEEPPGQSKLF